jgi:glycyl-tRNA synthetase
MENFYNKNGLVFWDESSISLREMFVEYFRNGMLQCLQKQNSAFQAIRVEAPLLTPIEFINKNYTKDDMYFINDELALRPETTMGSYMAAKQLLSGYNNIKYRPPIIIWQHGKSFRKEQDQPTKFMRLKEFYQLEFQAIYGTNTKNDYFNNIQPDIKLLFSNMMGVCRLEPSDRIPDYSDGTIDVICEKSNMEICSISKRKDFDGYSVLEIAIGTDRCVYNMQKVSRE